MSISYGEVSDFINSNGLGCAVSNDELSISFLLDELLRIYNDSSVYNQITKNIKGVSSVFNKDNLLSQLEKYLND